MLPTSSLIKRKLYNKLKEHLQRPEITIIVGPRQAGKTTLMRLLEMELKGKGERTLYLNLDIESEGLYFQSQEKLVQRLRLEFGDQRGFVFIDEIQRKENAGLFLKGLYDRGLPYKFIVSGSGSLELKEKIQESLAGRKRLFEITTITFEEFVNFRTSYRYEDRLEDFFKVEQTESRTLLEEYLLFGGYPRVVLEKTLEEKREILRDLYQSYVERDISYLLKVKKVQEFNHLLRILSHSIGQISPYQELAKETGISQQTLKDYLWYLEKTYIINTVRPFYKNPRKELTKSPLFYFLDLGLRNYLAHNFLRLTADGFLFQNFIYLLLREIMQECGGEIRYWRSKDGAEVDFVLLLPGEILVPLEVKFSELKEIRISRSLRSFLERYKPKKALIINLSFEGRAEFNSSEVVALPYFRLIKGPSLLWD